MRSRAGSVSIVEEMVFTLDTLTTAGQRHIMNKVVGFIRLRLRYVMYNAGRRHERAFVELLRDLDREAARPLPDVALFSQGIVAVLALLAVFR